MSAAKATTVIEISKSASPLGRSMGRVTPLARTSTSMTTSLCA